MTTLDEMLADLELLLPQSAVNDSVSIVHVNVMTLRSLISAIKSDRERVRREALEEAAMVCERYCNKARNSVAGNLAYDIRALKDKEPT